MWPISILVSGSAQNHNSIHMQSSRHLPAPWWWLVAEITEPDQPALISPEGETISRAAMSSAVRATAMFLRGRGVNDEDRLAIVFAPGPHQAVALLAGLGVATITPIQTTNPVKALKEDLRRLRVTKIITNNRSSAAVMQAADEMGLPVFNLEPFSLPPAPLNWQLPLPAQGQLALLMQSSGTTSDPKIVPLTHANLLAGARAVTEWLALDTSDRTLAVTPMSHIHGFVTTLLAPLISGGSVICCSDRAADQLLVQFKTCRPTWLSASPTLLLALADAFKRSGEPHPVHSLRFIRSVTMTLTSTARSQIETVFQVPVLEVYGMTEAASQVCSTRLTEHGVTYRSGTVGSAAGPEVTILTPTGEHCLSGVEGEVAIRGECVTHGYESAVHSGWVLDAKGESWFLTGDLGYLDDRAYLTLTGRLKEMVNRGGMKISPSRVDEALSHHPAVAEALAFPWPHPTLGDDLLAAVVLRIGATADEQQLREYLIKMLPSHEVPSRVFIVQALPRGSTGKLQRLGLAQWFADQCLEKSSPTQGDLEQLVASTFAEVLGLGDVSRDANFFMLGGDSLSSLGVILRLEQRLKLELSPTLIFSCPSVLSLTKRLAQLRSGLGNGSSERGRTIPPAVALQPLSVDGCEAFHASFGQARLWFLHQSGNTPSAYHLIAAWRLCGALNLKALDQALISLIERHPTLRTSFRLQDDTLLQIIHSQHSFQLQTELLGDRDLDLVIEDWLTQEETTPFDLSSGLLIRGRLLALRPDEHLLMLNHHHIASDGWSRNVLAEDFVAFYNAFCKGLPSKLRPLALHYQDYAFWQRECLQGRRLEDLLSYWRRQLDGLETLALQTDGRQGAAERNKGASVSFEIAPAQLNRFEAICRTEGATLHMGFLAVIALLLHRFYEQDDFAIGVPYWGRNDANLEPLVGFFVNTLPIRVRFNEQLSFRQLLMQVRDTSVDAYSHHELPFEKMVKALNIERDVRRNPLFQVMLQFMSMPVTSLDSMTGLLEVERVNLRPVDARFDLEFFLRRMSDGGIQGELIYDSSHFQMADIHQLVKRFHTLFETLVHEPNTSTAFVNVLPLQEREQIETWQVGRVLPRLGLTVDELFSQQAQRTPKAIAIVFENRQITYAELDLQADRLAYILASGGVAPNAIVAIRLDCSIERLVSILAVLKAGCAYLPIDASWPEQRQQDVLVASGVGVIITDTDVPLGDMQMQLQRFKPSAVSSPDYENPRTPMRGVSNSAFLAYVLYTSGSTGEPKGVAMSHDALTNLLRWQANSSDGRSRTLQFANIGFDVSFQEIFSTWISGGTLFLIAEPIKRDPSAMLALLRNYGIERLFLPVVMLEFIAQAAASTEQYPLTLKEVIVAGEALRITPSIRTFFKRLPRCRLWNHYGPTETHVVTAHLLSDEPTSWPDLPPIGQPIANTKVYVLDRYKQLTPIGLAGDIWIGGAALAHGYLRNETLTNERFVADPFDTSHITKLYRTGDRGRWRPDGQLEFLGRTDQQVKIRGHRVELGEIEAVLSQHPDLRVAAVVVCEGKNSLRYMVGFVASRFGSDVAPSSLRAWLQARLPEPLIPSKLVILHELPFNPNGKVDRKLLEQMAMTTDVIDAPSLNHTGVNKNGNKTQRLLEIELVRIWQQLFNRNDIDSSADFFELGGDSLSAVQMVLELERILGHSIPLSMLFSAPTITLLAQSIVSGAWTPEWTSSLVALQPNGSRRPLFFVHGVGGQVFRFSRFARALSPDQPVYGLRYKDGISPGAQLKSVEESATQYADEICALQPQGPYVLCGFSLGGWYAYAVATELLRRGAKVKLILFDTYPYCRSPWPAAGAQYLTNALRHLRDFCDDLSKISRTGSPMRIIKNKLAQFGVHRDSAVLEVSTDQFIEAVGRYVPKSIHIELNLFQATSSYLSVPLKISQATFWRLLVNGPINLHQLSCSHGGIFLPDNIPKLAIMVDELLSHTAIENRSN